VAYETVKYQSGTIGGSQPSTSVPGFADPAHYDSTKSSLSRPGGTNSVFGQGGLVDAFAGGVEDLQALRGPHGGLQNVIGAVQTAGTAYNTFKNSNLGQIAGAEARAGAKSVLQQGLAGSVRQAVNAGNGQFFPKAPIDDATGRRSNILSTAGVPTVRSQIGL
jgi:hypothetical protein